MASPDYEFADVTVDQSGKLSCVLVKLASVQDTAGNPALSEQQPAGPRQWYEAQGRQTLKTLVADLDSRGHNALTVQEDGSIRIRPIGDGAEVAQGTLGNLPAKNFWPELSEILQQDGLAAAVQDNCIVVTW